MTNCEQLVLYTKSFPFLPGEEFIETEITYLATKFKEVVIVPSATSDVVRSVPPNVRVDESLARELEHRSKLGSFLGLANVQVLRFLISIGLRKAVDFRTLLKVCRDWQFAKRVQRWLTHPDRSSRYQDSIHYSYWFSSIPTGLALYSHETQPILFMARCHRFDLYKHQVRNGVFPFRPFVWQHIQSVHSVTEDGRKHLLEDYQSWSTKIKADRLGVNDTADNPWIDTTHEIRVCSCAYVTPVKRLPLLADALILIATESPSTVVHWTHFGDGPELSGLKAQTQPGPSNLNCHFPGSTPNQEILSTYSEQVFDVFVNCSSSEGLPVSIMESMSAGIPVVATDVGGVSELVDENTGVLLPPDCTPRQIADAILKVKTGGVNLRESAKEAWRSKVNAEVNYSSFADMLGEMCATNNSKK